MAAASKDTTKTTEDVSLVEKVKRVIPGLSSSAPEPASSKKRSRKPKSAISAPLSGTAVGHSKDGDKTPLNGAGAEEKEPVIQEEDEQVEAKKTSAVEATAKRIRAANKKLVSHCSASIRLLSCSGRRAWERGGTADGHARASPPVVVHCRAPGR